MQKRRVLPVIFFIVISLFSFSLIGHFGVVKASIFDTGGGGFGGIFGGVQERLEGIFEGFRGMFPGGAVIPGITPTSPGPGPVIPPEDLPPAIESSKKVKLTLEWDALSLGKEAVEPERPDPLASEHINWIQSYGCPVCPQYSQESEDHVGEKWHYCYPQTACYAASVIHTLYGWCGHKPKVSGTVPSSARVVREGPNTYTLPNAVSNKYVRRDGYTYSCVRACDGGLCKVDNNYLEFQTEIYPSNAISMYLRAENPSSQRINNIEVKVRDSLSDNPLPQNLDYPIRDDEYVHATNLGEQDLLLFTNSIAPLRVEGDEFVFGPFSLLPGEAVVLPLQMQSSEKHDIPSGMSMNSGYSSELAKKGENIENSLSKINSPGFVRDLVDGTRTFLSKLLPEPATISAQSGTDAWYCCVANKLAEYMNYVLNADLPSNIKFMSPIFNVSSYTFAPLYECFGNSGAEIDKLDAIGVNLYNFGPNPDQRITYLVNKVKESVGSKPIFITETGMIEVQQMGSDPQQAAVRLAEDLRVLDPQVIAALLFSSFGTNGQFNYNNLTDEQIRYICNGNCGDARIGINSAQTYDQEDDFDSGGFYNHAAALGMRYSLSIAHGAGLEATFKGMANAFGQGITPIVRIGASGQSYGFDDPQFYVDYLRALAAAFPDKTFWAVAGPNEPDAEHWAAAACGDPPGEIPGPPLPPITGAPPLPPGEMPPPGPAVPITPRPGDPLDPNELSRLLGIGGIIPRDFNFICDPDDDLEQDGRCDGGLPNYIAADDDEYRDTTGIGGCGYWASSNNSVVGPIEITAEYGGEGDNRTSRSVLLASIPIGGRIVDNQARPYGWPTNGEIEQNWGKTGEAESQGYYRSDPTKEYGEYRYCSP